MLSHKLINLQKKLAMFCLCEVLTNHGVSFPAGNRIIFSETILDGVLVISVKESDLTRLLKQFFHDGYISE